MDHLLGFIFSWAIGLTPAFIYRYGIYGKPIEARKVFWRLAPIVAILCIVFKTTVRMLNDGVYNPNPLPWFFIYGAGCWIMTRSRAIDSKKSFKDSLPSAAVEVPLTTEKVSLVENVSVKSDDCILNNDKWEDIAMVNLSDKSDEQFYEIAQREFDVGDIAKGLMLKAEVAVGGDAGKARLLYIRTRAQELANEEKSLAVLREAISDAVNRGVEVDKQTLNSQSFHFNVFQKDPAFAPDMEYRLSLTDTDLRPDPKSCVDLTVGKCSDIMSIEELPKLASN